MPESAEVRFRVPHPDLKCIHALYGWSPALGWWCEVRQAGFLVESYDELEPGDTSVAGVLRVLVHHEFFAADELHEAAQHLQVLDLEQVEPGSVRRAAEVLSNLRLAGK